MKKTRVHVVSHTHWDREWYFNTARSTVYLINNIKDILEHLENNKDFHSFLMDAQSSLIDDYLYYYPEDLKRIKKLVKEKRLFIGPWYTQTDQLVISQESIVRNLYYGSKIAKNLGGYFNIAYAPDIFGQGGNLPQIYKQFNLNKFLFWRGLADNKIKETEFIWQGCDGTKILSKQIRNGYYIGGNLYEKENDILKNLEIKMKDLEDISISNIIYYPNGFDQAPIRKNLPEILSKYNSLDKNREYIHSSIPDYFKDLESNINKKDLKIIKGELTQAKHSRIHKSIFSTRQDLKKLNNKNENLLINVLEPILCISHSLNNRYPSSEIEKIFKLLFENAAHDSIGNCNSDSTNQDIYYRHKKANDYINNLLDLNMRLIANKIKSDKEYQFTLFNPYPENRDEVVSIKAYIPDVEFSLKDYNNNKLDYVITTKEDVTEYVLNQTIQLNPSKKIYIPDKVYLANILVYVKDIKALGYKCIYLDLESKIKQIEYLENKDKTIENDNYKVTFNDNNTLTILDKNNNILYKDQMEFEENSDDGDSYNYSPLKDDMVISSKDAEITSFKTYKSEVSQKMDISFKLKLPFNLEERKKKIRSTDYNYEVEVELRKNEKVIRFNSKFYNNVLSHRFCVIFDTNIASKMSIADQVFGIIERPVVLDDIKIWEKENWQEIPNCIEPMQSFVTLSDNNRGLSVITDCVKEYEIVGKKYSKIRLTLFRTFSHMGKNNLKYRPGRASGETIVKTDDAQLLQEINCDWFIHTYQSSFDNSNVAKISKLTLSPIQAYQKSDFLNGRLIFCFRDEEKIHKTEYSLIELHEDSVFSSIKKVEDKDYYLVRMYNPYINKSIEINNKYISELKLNEEEIKNKDNLLKTCKVRTFTFKGQ